MNEDNISSGSVVSAMNEDNISSGSVVNAMNEDNISSGSVVNAVLAIERARFRILFAIVSKLGHFRSLHDAPVHSPV